VPFLAPHELEDANTVFEQDAMSDKRGGTVIAVLPVSPETTNRRADVNVEFTLVYTELGYQFLFAGFEFPFNAEDKRLVGEHVELVMPGLLEGWKTGEGAPNFKPQRLRRMEGGLERACFFSPLRASCV
jgi:hypothetical protein